MKTAEAYRAGVSASTTSASNTSKTTFQRAAEAFIQTKNDVDCVVQVVVKSADKNSTF